ncbi:hypothetical protein D0T25_03960 [Duganella sp. BJB488]|nr:hypothetical protein D0T25_03960 [Duganella sp. BJB488]
MHFARLMHDYQDFESLACLFDTVQRRERLSSLRLASSANAEDIETAAHEVVAKLKEASDVASVTVQADGSLQLLVRYRKLHFNKSEFRQVEVKEAIVTLEREGDVIIVRGPQNEKVDEICNELISNIEAKAAGEVKIERIDLQSFPDSKARTQFFRHLIDDVPGYKRNDVTDVFLFNPTKDIRSSDDAESDNEDSEIEPETDLGIHISRASLKGGQVLESTEMKDLLAKGFYVSKIVWKAREASFDADLVEFEAQFSEPETCTKFSYLVKGYLEYQEEGKFSDHRKQFGSTRDREIGKLIETSARTAIQKLRNSEGIS